MSQYDLAEYQWSHRPRMPRRPEWFTEWPGATRLALNVSVLHEWESIPRPIRPMPDRARWQFDQLALSQREYGARHGIERLLRLFDKHEVKATVLVNGLLASLFPDAIADAHRRGNEIAVHNWDQAIHPPVMGRDEERASMRATVDAITKVTGVRPRGFMSQGPRPTENTLQLCADEGFTWTGDYGDSDFPYLIDVGGKKIVSVGYVFPAYTDNELAQLGLDAGLKQAIAEFDAVYAESRRHPMQYRWAAHSHISGRPGMASVLDEFLSYARSKPDVWIARSVDIADYWLAHERG